MGLNGITYISDSVEDSVLSIVRHFGVDYVTLHLFRIGDDAKNSPCVRTNYPDAWVSRYLLNDFVRIDPVLQKAKTTTEPFCWSTLVFESEHLGMMEQAVKLGVSAEGFSVSHVDNIGCRSVLSFNAEHPKGNKTWEPFLQENRDHLRLLASEMHQKGLSELFDDGDLRPHLSRRETECLKWTAEGKVHTEIAIILNLSEHTVRGYLKDARIKLDSVSLAQAVSKAASLGLIYAITQRKARPCLH